jgi:hypothetical protein
VDDFSLANPPSNEKLLDALAKDFVAHRYDLRALERAILNSRTYQLSHVSNASNRFDRVNFSHSYVRPLMAEVVVDAIDDALGLRETFGPEVPKGARAIEVGASRVQNASVAYAFRVFGRPRRTTACDCERATEPGLPQKLFLMADPVLIGKLNDPKNRIMAMLTSRTSRSADDMLNELFLATVSRLPSEREWAALSKTRTSGKPWPDVFADAAWALLNTTEFLYNH